MNPIKFPQMNATAAKNQAEYLQLPMHRSPDRIVSCWAMTWPERFKTFVTGRVWLSVMQPDNTFVVPALLAVDNPLSETCVHPHTQTLIDRQRVRVVCADPTCRHVISERQKV